MLFAPLSMIESKLFYKIGFNEILRYDARSIKQIENLGDTFLWISLALSCSRFFVKCFLNFSSDVMIYYYFYAIISMSLISSSLI
jgi:hypothetical protein